MVIMFIFIVAYGIMLQVILYPNSDLNILLVVDILKYAWWSIFGEFNIDEVSGYDQCVEFTARNQWLNCPATGGGSLSLKQLSDSGKSFEQA